MYHKLSTNPVNRQHRLICSQSDEVIFFFFCLLTSSQNQSSRKHSVFFIFLNNAINPCLAESSCAQATCSDSLVLMLCGGGAYTQSFSIHHIVLCSVFPLFFIVLMCHHLPPCSAAASPFSQTHTHTHASSSGSRCGWGMMSWQTRGTGPQSQSVFVQKTFLADECAQGGRTTR